MDLFFGYMMTQRSDVWDFVFLPQVQTIKQGYLLKRSSSLRADWKRRFFVLDSRGTLYYYRTKGPKPMVRFLVSETCFTGGGLLQEYALMCNSISVVHHAFGYLL